jgi:hypothetical protein
MESDGRQLSKKKPHRRADTLSLLVLTPPSLFVLEEVIRL